MVPALRGTPVNPLASLKFHIAWASSAVAMLVGQRHAEDQRMLRSNIVIGAKGMNTAAVLRGNLFELAAHALLLEGADRHDGGLSMPSCADTKLAAFRLRRQHDGLENPPPPPLGKLQTTRWFDPSGDWLQFARRRLLPASDNEPARLSIRLSELWRPTPVAAAATAASAPAETCGRALLLLPLLTGPVKHLVMFQVTAAKSHPESLDGILAAVEACGQDCQHVHLVFVLPSSINTTHFTTWQSYTRAGHVVPFDDMSDAEQGVIARVHQWVLRLQWPSPAIMIYHACIGDAPIL
jgi:hypothetical protein